MDSADTAPDVPDDAPAAPDPGAASRARKAELVRRLDRLGLLGLAIAEKAHMLAMRTMDRDIAAIDAAAPGEALPPAESNGPVLSFARASRAVRDTVAMELRVEAPPAAPQPDEDENAHRRTGAGRRRLNRMKDEVRREVENAIRANAKPADVRRLMFDLDERLDDAEVEAEFETLTQGQMVLRVCDDLGVQPDLTQWTVEMLREAYIAVFPDRPLPESLVERQHVLNGGLTKGPPVEKLPTGFIGSPGVPSALEMMGGLPAQTGAAPATAAAPSPDAPAPEEPLPPGYRRLGAMVFEPDGAALPRGAQAAPQAQLPRPSDAAAAGDASAGRLRNRLGGMLSR
jgi:hypothetical protein